jgi:hypothetical protein
MVLLSNRNEIAWAAGFFDGEGSTTARLRKGRLRQRPTTNVSIGNTNLDQLSRFNCIVGCGHIYGPRHNRNKSYKPIYQFMTTRQQDAEHILAMLWPHLGEEKRNQARLAVNRYYKEWHLHGAQGPKLREPSLSK